MRTTSSIIYLENTSGKLVRALHWTTEDIFVVYNLDSRRVETMISTADLDAQQIPYEILCTIAKKNLHSKNHIAIPKTNLRLVTSTPASYIVDPATPTDQHHRFRQTLSCTGAVGVLLLLSIFALSALFPVTVPTIPDLQVVQVIDRQATEKTVAPMMKPSPKTTFIKPTKKRVKSLVRVVPKKSRSTSQRGEVGILGTLTASEQKGGLRLNAVGASRGIGRGGQAGSGGIQTAVYSQGIFSAPLGEGQHPQGAGGYGTKGKGGGQAGYGKQSLVGSSSGYFQPLSSETWVEGGLDPNEIAAVIQRHESEIRACYEKGLRSQPNLKGRLSMKFLIGARGQVTTASISNSSLNHSGVETCIQARLRSWPFPQPEGGVTVKVSYPFVLKRVTGT